MTPNTYVQYPAAQQYVCRCLRVTEQDVRDACDAGAIHEVRDAMQQTGAGTGCMACRCALRDLIEDCRQRRAAAEAAPALIPAIG